MTATYINDAGKCVVGSDIDEFVARLLKERDAALKATEAALGYLTNASIDLNTGAPKRTAIATIEGGIKTIRAALLALSTIATERKT